jgi:fatty acid desaturase
MVYTCGDARSGKPHERRHRSRAPQAFSRSRSSDRQYARAQLDLLKLAGSLPAVRALLLYGLAYVLFLHALNYFDAFHHTFEQHFVEPDEALPMSARNAAYEQGNTYSNLISRRWPWLNLLVLNFGYHNAHHQRASVPWYRLPAYHRELYGRTGACELPVAALLSSWLGAHGVSFLTVV